MEGLSAMADLKLMRLPDRTPVRLILNLSPELNQALHDYARAYAVQYGKEEPVSELVPAMLQAFVDSDREFAPARRKASSA